MTIPVRILQTEENIPASIYTEYSNTSVEYFPGDLLVVWDFGHVVNPVNDSVVMLELAYEAVILNTNITNSTFQIEAASFADFYLLSFTAPVDANVLVPMLIVAQTASVSHDQ